MNRFTIPYSQQHAYYRSYRSYVSMPLYLFNIFQINPIDLVCISNLCVAYVSLSSVH